MANINITYDPVTHKLESGEPILANQAASTAADVATMKTDFNALLTKLKAAGIMVADT